MKSRKVRRAKKSRKNARRGGGRFITKKICVSGDPDTEEENKWFGKYLNDFQNNAMPTLETHQTTRPQTKFIRDYFDFGFKTKKKCYDKEAFVRKVKTFCKKYKGNDVKPTDGGYLAACYSNLFKSSEDDPFQFHHTKVSPSPKEESVVRGDYTQPREEATASLVPSKMDLPPEDTKESFVRGDFTQPREEASASLVPRKRHLTPAEKEAFFKKYEYKKEHKKEFKAQVDDFLNKYSLPLG